MSAPQNRVPSRSIRDRIPETRCLCGSEVTCLWKAHRPISQLFSNSYKKPVLYFESAQAKGLICSAGYDKKGIGARANWLRFQNIRSLSGERKDARGPKKSGARSAQSTADRAILRASGEILQ